MALLLKLQVEKAQDLVMSIRSELEQAVRERCDCTFSSIAIRGEKFSCETIGNVLATHLVYRAALNGSSDLLPASTAMKHIQDWVDSDGTLDYFLFRLRLTSTTKCKLSIQSMNERAC